MQGSAVHWAAAAAIATSAFVGAGSLIRYQWLAKRNREQDLSRLNAQEAIRNAVYTFHARNGEWPVGKSDIKGLVRFSAAEMKWIRSWDCKLKSTNRTETVLRYSIMVDGEWLDWDAKIAAPLQHLIS